METHSCAPGALDASDAATRLERTTVKTEDETYCANAWESVNKLPPHIIDRVGIQLRQLVAHLCDVEGGIVSVLTTASLST